MVIQNSSISSSESSRAWRRFVIVLAFTLVALVVVCYGFLLLMDPYDSVPFSPTIKRVQVDENQQRYFYPALARDPKFDSALIGNSNIRLLRPDMLTQSLGGNWVNLAVNAASSWEQEQLFNVFAGNHGEIANILVGMDYLWCEDRYAQQRFVGHLSQETFPAWLYDDNTANDLPPLTVASLQHAWLLFLTNIGLRQPLYGEDGYTVFTDPISEYRLDKARKNIYGSVTPKKVRRIEPAVKLTAKARRRIPISALTRLETMLDQLPESTRIILFFVPYHSYYQAQPGSRKMIMWNECKRRVSKIASRYDNAYVLDFMIRSKITRTDSNYWDHKHYTVTVGDELTRMIGEAVAHGAANKNYRVLHAPQ